MLVIRAVIDKMLVRIANMVDLKKQSDLDLCYLAGNYGKCSKIWNAFHFLVSKKKCITRAGIHKVIVRIANREDPAQTASSEAV